MPGLYQASMASRSHSRAPLLMTQKPRPFTFSRLIPLLPVVFCTLFLKVPLSQLSRFQVQLRRCQLGGGRDRVRQNDWFFLECARSSAAEGLRGLQMGVGVGVGVRTGQRQQLGPGSGPDKDPHSLPRGAAIQSMFH